MIILDTALAAREKAGRPIRIGLVGAGFMGRGIAAQLCTPLTGMRLAAISSRRPNAAQEAWAAAGVNDVVLARTQREIDSAIAANRPVATSDATLLCNAAEIDVVMEVVGDIDFSAQVVLDAIAAGKHVVMMNAELDATVGPLLKAKADEAGVILSNADGDEPGIIMNLYRHVRSIGYKPVLAGNLKGFLDHHRTADTQRAFAEKTGQRAVKCAAYADGTKLSFEACLVANATGMQVAQRGMMGPQCEHVKDVVQHFSPADLLQRPLVDYVLGAAPGSGAFVVGYNDEPSKQHYMDYLKMGSGPLYVFYSPYVLPHLEAPLSAARAVLFRDAAVTPLGAPVCDVVTIAKRDLHAGETLDGIGGNAAYGTIENVEIAHRENLLPMGLSEDCRVLRDIKADQPITYDDVELPPDRLSQRLREQQDRMNFSQAETSNGHSAHTSQDRHQDSHFQIPASSF